MQLLMYINQIQAGTQYELKITRSTLHLKSTMQVILLHIIMSSQYKFVLNLKPAKTGWACCGPPRSAHCHFFMPGGRLRRSRGFPYRFWLHLSERSYSRRSTPQGGHRLSGNRTSEPARASAHFDTNSLGFCAARVPNSNRNSENEKLSDFQQIYTRIKTIERFLMQKKQNTFENTSAYLYTYTSLSAF